VVVDSVAGAAVVGVESAIAGRRLVLIEPATRISGPDLCSTRALCGAGRKFSRKRNHEGAQP